MPNLCETVKARGPGLAGSSFQVATPEPPDYANQGAGPQADVYWMGTLGESLVTLLGTEFKSWRTTPSCHFVLALER